MWAMLYGLATLIAILLTLRQDAPLKCGLLLMADWMGSNAATAWLGFARAPMVIAPLDGVIALLILSVGVANNCRIGYTVFSLFLLGAGVHVWSYTQGSQADYATYAVLNVIYLAAVVVVGASGVRFRLARWLPRLNDNARATSRGA